jgi:hypothetical protein
MDVNVSFSTLLIILQMLELWICIFKLFFMDRV